MPKRYNDLYLATRKILKDMGVEAHSLEARILVAKAADKSPDVLFRDLMLYTSDETVEKLKPMLARRLMGEPVAYITGEWEFYGLPILVNQNVLIPRADTEIMVDYALKALKGKKMDARILDLCSGSGCIGCAMAANLPASRVVLVDISSDALSISRKNSQRLSLTPRVTCLEADVLKPPPMLVGNFDVIMCNPPYITPKDYDELDISVKEFEPKLALVGGEDGLDYYRAVLKNWKSVLRHGGLLMFEVGYDQAEAVKTMMLIAGFLGVESLKDTGGIDRVVVGRA